MPRKPRLVSRGGGGQHHWGCTFEFPRGLQQEAEGSLVNRFINERGLGE